MYTVELRFVKKAGKKVNDWWVLNPAGEVIARGYTTREAAQAYADKRTAEAASAPAPATQAAPQTGWSKYSRRQGGDYVSSVMEGSFGLTSPTKGTWDCHYCGLDRRTCDCH